MHLHLDPVGGVAGDMFVAAMVDLRPSLTAEIERALERLEIPEGVLAKVVDHNDGTLRGSRFEVRPVGHAHEHRSFADIKIMLAGADLAPAVHARMLDIFSRLARAEGHVHGVEPDDVQFHEVGAWDSIADIAAAAVCIEECGADSWSVGALPLGSGLVETAHGMLPVPAPATAMLLEGFDVLDDGIAGERTTPTGAAILGSIGPSASRPPMAQRLGSVGTGFGSRVLEGRPNILRVLELISHASLPETVGIIEFDIDDQTAEDLAVGLDRLRSARGVLDVLQRVSYGKKGRLVTEVRVLCHADCVDDVVRHCLAETTTIGVRWALQGRYVLPRQDETAPSGTRIKTAQRPDGRRSVKVEMDELAALGDHQTREEHRRRVEGAVEEGREE